MAEAEDRNNQEEEPKIEETDFQPNKEMDQLKKEVAEFKDKYQRALAEAENARKRLQKEKQEMIQYSLQNVFAEFLNPIDHLENALKFADQASDDVKHWALGFQMILNQFKDVLSDNGVSAFSSVGMHFDPQRHEAIEIIHTNEYEPGTVIGESLRGYKMGERTIRPARVTVAKADEKQENKDKKIEQNSKS
jgi:molecular chaperone GrpE